MPTRPTRDHVCFLLFIVMTLLTSHVAFSPPPSNSTTPSALSRPKRKQVKMAVSLTFVIFLDNQPILDRSVRTVPELASVATNNDPVSDVSNMALPKHVWMASEKRGRKVSSVVLTSARARASRMAVSRVCFTLLPPSSYILISPQAPNHLQRQRPQLPSTR